jgi:hypothetical protein
MGHRLTGDVLSAQTAGQSGLAHFTAARGLPTIVLSKREMPRFYQPLGNSTVNYDNLCMLAISVEQVFNLVTDVLNATNRSSWGVG